MTWWEAIVLGVVQGLTEFLPISSSAHLRIVGDLLPGGGDPGAAFTAITQLGTETAVLIYFRKDIWRIIRAWFGALPVGPWRGTVPKEDPDARMGWYIIIGSVPIVVFGLLFQDAIETSLRHLYITAAMLAGFAILLGVADRLGRKRKELRELTLRDGLLFGLAQSLALVPGVSRSGGTITMGLLLGYTREAAARYSFLLAIPAVFGSGFYQLLGADPAPDAPGAGATAIATVVAFGVGFLVIIAFLKIVSTYSYMPFVIYRIVLAVLVVAGVAAGVLDPLGAAAGAE
ncbi:undecaprenyl-diphosphatase [Georgenia satyanarayanai]|uniref:Undecaprenyl-diphosphatase n=1 Tax=Georgenia satyanarayanai TaxID=860221 RepID=A0A2Y9C787_9MICO|nr:undecaprenyl-diphosphate phosphatase [Georgenia satyanarayanai]PYF98885.1 undecaprenyl-diphosphatase [Georgenia satyanarayanai]SSA44733.1 undecaprenyl-diphosphatase [Georgenia satyanarayanai]